MDVIDYTGGKNPGQMSGTSTNGHGKGHLRLSARLRNASSNWKIRTQVQ
jgi:hypothetical protein